MTNKTSEVETIVVGAGPAGVMASRCLQISNPGMQILVLEAGERMGGKALSGLHLVDARGALNFDIRTGPELQSTRVRWEKSWVDPKDVDWSQGDWIGKGKLPQWKSYFEGPKKIYLGLSDADIGIAIKDKSPVSKIQKLDDASQDLWTLETPRQTYIAQRVVWASGLTAFQNAYGKHESQEFLAPNPRFAPQAQDFRGGVGLEISLPETLSTEEGFDASSVFALPFKHGGFRHLILGALLDQGEKGWLLKTLTHVHSDTLIDPKEVLSFQKSLRRALRGLFPDAVADDQDHPGANERWVVSPRVGGHVLGSPWLLGAGVPASLDFLGEESVAATGPYIDTLGALESVTSLRGVSLARGAESVQP